MNRGQGFSEEFLNAFIDNQLEPEEKARAYALLSNDEEFNRRVCELRKVRDLVQLAFKEVAVTRNPGQKTTGRVRGDSRRHALAIGLLLIGVAIGWGFRTGISLGSNGSVAGQAVLHRQAVLRAPGETKVLFHLNSGRHRRMREVLDEAQNLLRLYHVEKHPAEVEIIANGAGIDLLRVHHSPFAARIQAMHEKYPNLTFAACQDTIDRLISQDNIHPHLLPEATIVPSGVAQIIRLQQRGWTYIRV
ncbi:MAG: hypothetical protein ACYDB1_08655 [Acidiferrobacteraceae bacterium]